MPARIVWIFIGVLLLVLTGLAAGEVPPDTHETRQRAYLLEQKRDTDCLLLPFIRMRQSPQKVTADQFARFDTTYPCRIIWDAPPWQEIHAEFIDKFAKAAKPNEQFQLVDWCEKNKLPECAEFVLRNLLKNHNWKQQHPEYKRAIGKWLPLAKKRRAGHIFDLPLKGEWYVIADVTRHHQAKAWAAFAFDFMIKKNGKYYRTAKYDVKDYYSWDQPVFAGADGVVVKAMDGYPDLPIGKLGDESNLVIVDYGGGLHGVFGHLKKGSIKVKVGDRIKSGDEVGRVGNSGASSLPHLHYDIYDDDYLSIAARYRYEMRDGSNWVRVTDGPLVEGSYVRPLTPERKEN